jgi:uncharacterized membrane protein
MTSDRCQTDVGVLSLVTHGLECLACSVSQNLPLPVRLVELIENSPLSRALDHVLTTITGPFVPSEESPFRTEVLGHRLHPVLTDLPLGCWTSATLIDVLGGKAGRSASTRLIAVGLLAAGPTAYAGLADWSRLQGNDRHLGAVHAIGNDVAIVLFASSFLARVRGQYARGVRLALLGNVATAAAGHLGGVLALGRGTASR